MPPPILTLYGMEERVMNCLECGTTMSGPTRERVPYACGLPEVYLDGVQVWRCPACGDEEIEIPAVEELHEALTRAVAKRPGRLTPAEIRFIRESKGWSSTMAAEQMEVALGTWSKWEHGKLSMSAGRERLLRLLAVIRDPVTEYADLLSAPAAPATVGLTIRLGEGEHWEMAAAK